MLTRGLCTALSVVVSVWMGIASAEVSDTTRLTEQLRSVRGKDWLTAEYASIRSSLLSWIDTRVQNGQDVANMNQELQAAGLFRPDSSGEEPDFGTLAGYLAPISRLPLKGTRDVVALAAHIFRGANCSMDGTVILYQQPSRTRLAYIHANPNDNRHAYYVAGVDVGSQSASGERLIASGWVGANCTSSWNGKRIRIDRVTVESTVNVLSRDLNAQDSPDGENVSPRVDGSLVTFYYRGATGDGELLSGPSIARYCVETDRAVQVEPVALTRAGFIHEWLHTDESEATRWSESAAAQAHSAIARQLRNGPLEWVDIRQCPGPADVWEIAVSTDAAGHPTVFRIAGSRATKLRMLAVSDKLTPSCKSIGTQNLLSTVGLELPW